MPTHMLACPTCRLFLHVVKNGVVVEEGMPLKPAEDDKPAEWAPYKLWEADLWACEGCGFQLIAGFGNRPIAEHYQPAYQACRAASPPMVRIDDCPGGTFNEGRAKSRRLEREQLISVEEAAARYPLAVGKLGCGEPGRNGYICTRAPGHVGPHVAHLTATEAVDIWTGSRRACNESAKGVGSR